MRTNALQIAIFLCLEQEFCIQLFKRLIHSKEGADIQPHVVKYISSIGPGNTLLIVARSFAFGRKKLREQKVLPVVDFSKVTSRKVRPKVVLFNFQARSEKIHARIPSPMLSNLLVGDIVTRACYSRKKFGTFGNTELLALKNP